MSITIDQYQGCVLGLALGDALGAPYEGGLLERGLWKLIGKTRAGCWRWTDDTQMAVDLAESILAEGRLEPNALAQRFARSYRWSRGYGAGTRQVLRRIAGGEAWESAAKAVYPTGSYGNGAAMRSPVLALCFPDDPQQLRAAAEGSARVTHQHPLGIAGAVAIATATRALLLGQATPAVLEWAIAACQIGELQAKLETAARWLDDGTLRSPQTVVNQLGNGMTVLKSCPTALYIALSHRDQPFAAAIAFANQCGGDTDTIGAMAGALWGAGRGASGLPDLQLEQKPRLVQLAEQVFKFALAGT